MENGKTLREYARQIERAVVRGDATERTHYPTLQALLQALEKGVTATSEPKRIECGAPDFRVSRGQTTVGYVEAKDVRAGLDEALKTDQLKRYRESLGNLVLTNYLEFRWFVDGTERGLARIGTVTPAGKMAFSEAGAEGVLELLRGFYARKVPSVGTPKELAERMARLGRMTRDLIVEAFEREPEGGTLHSQLGAFRETLIPDLGPEQFADMYAQTIAYGLFAAWAMGNGGGTFTRQNAEWLLPKTNPFLRSLFHHIAGPDLDDRIAWVVDDLAQLLAEAEMAAVLDGFGKRTKKEDPVVHFYETFLKEYDPKMREMRGAIIYRSMSAATKGSRIRAERRLGWIQGIVAYLRGFVELPRVNFPVFDVPDEPVGITKQQINECASQCRRFWGMGDGPIGNVVWLLENNGAIVARDAVGADTLDAFSVWSRLDGAPYVVLSSDKECAARSRFDAAHELGHLVLHRNVEKTRLGRLAEHRLIEDQAHMFAGSFLLPASTFADDFYVPTLDSIRVLKSKWMVSIGAMIKRAAQLDLITSEQERRLWINYTRRGWRGREPLDDELPIEQPRLLKRSMELIVENGIEGVEAVVEGAPPYQPMDIERLAGLQPGYFGGRGAPVQVLEFSRGQRRVRRAQSGDPGDIVDFPGRQ